MSLRVPDLLAFVSFGEDREDTHVKFELIEIGDFRTALPLSRPTIGVNTPQLPDILDTQRTRTKPDIGEMIRDTIQQPRVSMIQPHSGGEGSASTGESSATVRPTRRFYP